jgi:hypothetical protein
VQVQPSRDRPWDEALARLIVDFLARRFAAAADSTKQPVDA